jgi:hypothetical protein
MTKEEPMTYNDGGQLSLVPPAAEFSLSPTAGLKHEFRKHVAAIHTSGELSLLEHKLVNVLLLNAFDNLRHNKSHRIPVKLLCSMIGWEGSQDIPSLKKALKKIVTTPVEFDLLSDPNDQSRLKWSVSTLLAFADIENGMCTYEYSTFLAERLSDPEIYAIISVKVQKLLNSSYSLKLYENCYRFKRVGSTGWIPVATLKKLLGAESTMYEQFKHFNNFVLDKSMKEINRVSDLKLSVEFKKESRKVVEVKFKIEEKNSASNVEGAAATDFEAVKEKASFKRLVDHGISARLAAEWVMEDEDKVTKVLDYVDQKARNNEIKRTTAGYIRILYKDPAVSFAKSPNQTKKEAAAKAGREAAQKQAQADDEALASAKQKDGQVKEMLSNLSVDEIAQLVQEYAESAGAGSMISSFNPQTGKFRSSLERVAFHGWVRSKKG